MFLKNIYKIKNQILIRKTKQRKLNKPTNKV